MAFEVNPPEWSYVIEFHKFRQACRDLFGREYDFEHDGQNSYIEVDVSDEGPDGWYVSEAEMMIAEWLGTDAPPGLKSWERDCWFRDHGPQLPLDVMLWHLARSGVIPYGSYLMKVWW